jgi:hypothetical protein
MKTNTLKQLALFIICSISLYLSGINLINMSSIKSLLDGLNVMIFFTSFFPFLFLLIALFSKIFKSFFKFTTH